MNIFHLHTSPEISAEMMCDKHVVKMILETAQLLSTAHRVLDGELIIKEGKKHRYHPSLDEVLYKSTHENHPSAIWVRESKSNYEWLFEHFHFLNKEYRLRSKRSKISDHLSYDKLSGILQFNPVNIPDIGLTKFKECMPDDCKLDNPVMSYRNYYIKHKSYFAKWSEIRGTPDWYKNGDPYFEMPFM